MTPTGLSKQHRRAPARQQQPAVLWLLIASFLLQPILTYLVTPVVAHHSNGQTVVVCTLQGSKLVTLDLPVQSNQFDAQHCPALKLLQIAGSATPVQLPALPTRVFYSVAELEEPTTRTYSARHFQPYSTRAPPVA